MNDKTLQIHLPAIARILCEADRERFIAKTIRSTDSDCWIWKNKKDKWGYGRFTCGKVHGRKRQISAHRASHILFIGPIPDGLCVLHKCDTPACVNPRHLYAGTFQQNTADMMDRKRCRCGSSVANAKLTEDDVRKMRALHMDGFGEDRLSKMFKVARSTARDVIKRRRWRHVS